MREPMNLATGSVAAITLIFVLSACGLAQVGIQYNWFLLASADGATLTPSTNQHGGRAVNVRDDFNVECNGTDETNKIQAALTAGAGGEIIFPKGTCGYRALSFSGTGTIIEGQGRSATVLQQLSTSGDGIYVGDSAAPGTVVSTYHYTFMNLTIAPKSAITSGFAVHLHNVMDVLFLNMDTGGDLINAYGCGNCNYGGIWADHAGGVHLEHSEIWGSAEVLRINDSVDSALHYTNLRFGTIGLHLAGGVSGLHCTQSNIESNVNNMYVDNSQDAGAPNHVNSFGTACAFDSSKKDNVVINTPLGGLNEWLFDGASIGTQGGAAVNVISAPNYSYLIFSDAIIGSSSGSSGDCIKLQDNSVILAITAGTQVFNCKGWGINETYSPGIPNNVFIDRSVTWGVAGGLNTSGNFNFTPASCMYGFTLLQAECVSRQVADNSASLTWSNLPPVQTLYMVCNGMVPASNGSYFQGLLGYGTAPTYVATYPYAWIVQSSAPSAITSGGRGDSTMDLTAKVALSNNTALGASWNLQVNDSGSSTQYKDAMIDSTWHSANSVLYEGRLTYSAEIQNPITSIKIKANNGNIARGTCTLKSLTQ